MEMGRASVPAAESPLALLVNPSSAGGRTLRLLPQIEAELDQRRAVFRVERTRDPGHAVEEALRAADAGEIPVLISGDGLIGVVGGALAGSETPLGIIPGGRGNDLARVLGIPSEAAEAVDALLTGHSRRIDMGEVNGHRFVGVASVGLDSDANRIANETRLIRGNLVYAYAALRALATWKPDRFTIRVGGERFRFTGCTVAVANNKAYGGGMFIAPDALLDDGEFDVVMIGDVSRLRLLRNLPKVFKGTHVQRDEVRVFRTPELALDASRPLSVWADGEHLTDLPATVRILPAALSVIVPATAA